MGRVGVAATSSGHCNVKRPSPLPIPPHLLTPFHPRSSYDQVCYLDGAFTAETSAVLLIFHERETKTMTKKRKDRAIVIAVIS